MTTLAALGRAVADEAALDAWVAGLPEPARAPVRRALALDRALWTEHPASLASCLLARTLAVAELDALRAAWVRELDAGGPWVRALRALPVPEGLLAELHESAALPLAGLHRLGFAGDEEVTLESIRHHPSVQAPELRRRDMLRWRWRTGEARVVPEGPEPARPDLPAIEHPQWGPSYLVREPGGPRTQLPCPEEGTADARFSADGARLFVYGSNDEYAGGFVYVLDPRTLEITRSLDTDAPVSGVQEAAGGALVLVSTFRGSLLWSGTHARALPVAGGLLSPSGELLATQREGLRVWSLAALARGRVDDDASGLVACFDPSGERLISGPNLYEGRSGARVARLQLEFGNYLEGGPASPSVHFGERYLINLSGVPQVWDARTGAAVRVRGRVQYPQWYTLAYDRAGVRMAALRRHDPSVALHELPSGRTLRTLAFDLAGEALALSPDGALIAAAAGPAVELRDAAGALLWRAGEAPRARPDRGERSERTLLFSREGEALARFVEEEGWRVWSLRGEEVGRVASLEALAQVPGFAPPRPRGWTIEAGTRTLFRHEASGATIGLPAAGPWVCNPAAPEIAASNALHVELRGPGAT